jgi:O-antigen/teichoic acid export membrane protein
MFRKIMNNDFNRNVATLLTGSTVAQALPIAISPILTRLYSPSDFGVLALFVSFTAILGAIANARYELAIVLPEKEEEAINIVALCLLISTGLSVCILLIVIFFHDFIIRILNNTQIGQWLYFIPIVVFMMGMFNALNYYNTRIKAFKDIAKGNVYKSLALAIVQLVLGLLKQDKIGLLVGQIASPFFGNFQLGKNFFKNNKSEIKKVSFQGIKNVGKKYINFLKFSMWSTLCNTLSQQLTSVFISIVYSTATLGQYSLVQRILGMPITLIGNSMGQVYFQKAAEEKSKRANSTQTFVSTLKKLLVIALPTFILIYISVEEITSIIFGEQWRLAGEYTKYILPLFFFRFITAPLSVTNSIYEKQKISLIWQVTLLLISLIIFLIAFLMNLSIKKFLLIFSSTLSIHYIILLYILFITSKGSNTKDTFIKEGL